MARLVVHTAKNPVKIEGKAGDLFICRCGLSKNKPFCDKSHLKVQDESEDYMECYDENGQKLELDMENCCGAEGECSCEGDECDCSSEGSECSCECGDEKCTCKSDDKECSCECDSDDCSCGDKKAKCSCKDCECK